MLAEVGIDQTDSLADRLQGLFQNRNAPWYDGQTNVPASPFFRCESKLVEACATGCQLCAQRLRFLRMLNHPLAKRISLRVQFRGIEFIVGLDQCTVLLLQFDELVFLFRGE